jgi:hypothetical protein
MVKFWTLMSGTSYIASISIPSYTSNPLCAVAYDSIKKADIAANRWKRKYGLPVMVHVILEHDVARYQSEDGYEDQAHSAFYGENL